MHYGILSFLINNAFSSVNAKGRDFSSPPFAFPVLFFFETFSVPR